MLKIIVLRKYTTQVPSPPPPSSQQSQTEKEQEQKQEPAVEKSEKEILKPPTHKPGSLTANNKNQNFIYQLVIT